MAESSNSTKRPRSSSVASSPEAKRPNLDMQDLTEKEAPANGEVVPASDSQSAADPQPSDVQDAEAESNPVEGEVNANEGDVPEQAVEQQPAPAEEDKAPHMTMKALIVTQDASIIIGKSGVHIREIRDKAGAKVSVSEAIPNNPERILSVAGPLDAVSKAYGLIVRRINDEPYDSPSVPGSKAVTIRFIVPNSRMGSVIGKGGSKIKEIQEASGARLQASEAMLPGSTERVLTLAGVADAIHIAVYYVGTILQEHSDRPQPNTPYRPGGGVANPPPSRPEYYSPQPPHMGGAPPAPYRPDYRDPYYGGRGGPPPPPQPYQPPTSQGQTQQLFVPEEYVRSIIGKGGAKINEIRQQSGTHIKIMEPAEQAQMNAGGNPGERLVTVTGQPANIKVAIDMMYYRLEQERNRLRP